MDSIRQLYFAADSVITAYVIKRIDTCDKIRIGPIPGCVLITIFHAYVIGVWIDVGILFDLYQFVLSTSSKGH